MSEGTTNKISLVNLPDLPDCADNAIMNLTDVPTKNVGQTFGDIWYLVFGGISHAADKKRMKYAADLDKYRQELTQSIDKIPESKKVEPSIQVTAQALENSKYCISEKELRQLFVNLISGSMDSAFSSSIHPCFAEIIKQMNPIDAKILSTLPLKGSVPVVDYIVRDKSTNIYAVELTNVYLACDDVDIFGLSNSLSSLCRLGLVSLGRAQKVSDDSLYDVYLETDFFKQLSGTVQHQSPDKEATIKKYVASLTPLGQNFVYSCVR